jgi:hypothetical protein
VDWRSAWQQHRRIDASQVSDRLTNFSPGLISAPICADVPAVSMFVEQDARFILHSVAAIKRKDCGQ